MLGMIETVSSEGKAPRQTSQYLLKRPLILMTALQVP
jgi:hypothetical protein